MENETQEPRTESIPQKKSPPSDIETFLSMLPLLVGSFASKHGDPKTASDLAINLAREETAHLVMNGCAIPTLVCNDGRPLALFPGAAAPGSAQNPIGSQNKQGAMVAQFDNQNIQRIQGL
jgi:hypothetical protein